MPVDPPSKENAVYLTSDLDYATWHAARSGHGDVYEASPMGDLEPTLEDNFFSYTVPLAKVVRVVRRKVWLDRRERRSLMRRWAKADKARRQGGRDDSF